jgi:glycosyltransferase involved in cell wall biosynthesis
MVSILALSFHPAFYPPKSGGEQRLYYIYHYLSNFYDITLISFTYPNPQNKIEVVEHNKHFREIRVPKTKLSQFLHHLVEKFSNIKECSAIITSIESRFNKNFKKVIKDDLRDADAVIFVYPYLFIVPARILKSKKIVYESHNIEYELMKQSLPDSIIGKILLRYVYHIEKSLSRRSRLIFAVSEEDRDKLSQTYKINKNKIYISSNGVNLNEYANIIRKKRRKKSKNHPFLYLFIGSYHPPNIEAIENITKFACELPEDYFIVAGSASQYYISYTSNLLEQTDFENFYYVFDLNKKISLVSGFYNPEFWDSIPTVWSKPSFKICVSEGIESIEMKIYSHYNQKLEVELDDEAISLELKENWNSGIL